MRISTDAYRKGLVSWTIDSPAAIFTATSNVVDAPVIWSLPLVDPLGSAVISPPGRFCRIRIEVQDQTALTRPWEVRWEREYGHRLQTLVYTIAQFDPPISLEDVPNFGTFHRLVMRTSALDLREGAVIRVGDLVVRFVVGKIIGERTEPTRQVTISPNQYSIEGGWIGTVEEEGRFIEIIAPGTDREHAESNARRTLGLIAVCMGPHSLGEEFLSEHHVFSREGGGTIVTESYGVNPWHVSDDIVDAFHGALSQVERAGEEAMALSLAARWYERGMRSSDPTDQVLSCFIGIEAIVTAFSRQHGPTSEEQERQRHYERIEKDLLQLLGHDKRALKRLRDKMVEPSLSERFRSYAMERKWDSTVEKQFAALYSKRSKLFHGSSVTIQDIDGRSAKRLLGRLIRRELDLPESMEWETLPLRFPIRTEGQLGGVSRERFTEGDLRGTVFDPDKG